MALLAAACGGDDESGGSGDSYALALEGASPLTDQADDLFSWRMSAGEPLALEAIEVFAQEPGQQTYGLSFRLSEDADADGSFGPGDVLTVFEPADIFGADANGRTIVVSLMRKLEGNAVRELHEETWTP